MEKLIKKRKIEKSKIVDTSRPQKTKNREIKDSWHFQTKTYKTLDSFFKKTYTYIPIPIPIPVPIYLYLYLYTYTYTCTYTYTYIYTYTCTCTYQSTKYLKHQNKWKSGAMWPHGPQHTSTTMSRTFQMLKFCLNYS